MSTETLTYDPGAFGAMPLAPEINHVVGTAAMLLARPSGERFLVLRADKGGFRVRRGDFAASGMPATELPDAAVTDGSGALYLAEGQTLPIPCNAASVFTVKGYAAASVLTYFWR
ncbi:hypothetical protein [Roseococcus sp.]|uniref:hypothetical protein n=1 Tax=Roseococcus sp. TaxID=2109646 RepID=UPI003BAAD987